MRRVLLLGLAVALAVAGSPARAAGPPVVTVTAAYFDYFPGGSRTLPELELHVPRGSTLIFANIDAVGGPHSVIAVAEPGQPPAFESDAVDPPRVVPVRGVEALQPGAYLFTCLIHPDLMWGTLHVDP